MVRKDWIDLELERNLDRAVARSKVEQRAYPHAVAARFDSQRRHVVVQLDNGAELSFPVKLAQGLAKATPKALAAIEVTPAGDGLLWPQLGATLSVHGMLLGVFGNKVWMQSLARKGGSATSSAKAAAARANGAKGGRPRRVAA